MCGIVGAVAERPVNKILVDAGVDEKEDEIENANEEIDEILPNGNYGE